jgi:Trypsin/Regulatory CLIP domain of proteinases
MAKAMLKKFLFIDFFQDGVCITTDKNIGYCVKVNECLKIRSIVENEPVSNKNKTYLRRNQCGYSERQPYVCCDASLKLELLPASNSCGPSFSSPRILGGSQTSIDEFPWTALVQYQQENSKELSFGCGGSLINQNYVLTAAHCVVSKVVKKNKPLVKMYTFLGQF